MRRCPRLLAFAVPGLIVLARLAPASAGAAAPGPVIDVPLPQLQAAFKCPAGFRHPEHDAVLLVHGTSVTADENWAWNYLPQLPKVGFDACTIQMPNRALSDMQISSEYVVWAIREEAQLSHRRIDTIGLSQGGIEPRWALTFWPDIHHLVSKYIGMATPNHGAFYGFADCVHGCPPAIWQQSTGSNYMNAVNAVETPYRPEVSYTSIYSLTDDIIQPAFPTPTAALAGASNIAVQDVCPGHYVGHIQSAWDAAYYAIVMDALLHPGPADPGLVDRSYCSQPAMPGVDPVFGWQETASLYVEAGEVQAEYPDKPSHEPPLRCYATAAGCPRTASRHSEGVTTASLPATGSSVETLASPAGGQSTGAVTSAPAHSAQLPRAAAAGRPGAHAGRRSGALPVAAVVGLLAGIVALAAALWLTAPRLRRVL